MVAILFLYHWKIELKNVQYSSVSCIPMFSIQAPTLNGQSLALTYLSLIGSVGFRQMYSVFHSMGNPSWVTWHGWVERCICPSLIPRMFYMLGGQPYFTKQTKQMA